ncbi:MAG: hypothetical protein ABJE47_01020 [bacterium]
MPHSLPPFALAVPVFRFRSLANLAGRAPIGGAREVALACFVAARLVAECSGAQSEDAAARVARSAGAKAWLGTLALPTSIRAPVTRCAELSVGANHVAAGKEIAGLAAAAAPFLDAPSKAELDALAALLGG